MRILRWLAVFVILAAGVAARADDSPHKYAVVVGVNTYENQDVTPLRYAVADAKALAATLRAAGFDKVFELTSDTPGSENYPSRTNLLFRLDWVRERARPQDTVVFFFSGHGVEMPTPTAAMEKEMFLLTKESDPRSLITIKASACRALDITEVLKAVKANQVLVVYDACRANPKADKAGGDNKMGDASRDLVVAQADAKPQQAAARRDKVVATVFACSPGQRSYEWNDKKHGYFTWYLIEGLKGGASKSGKVTLQSLLDYVLKQVRQAADEAGHEQVPWEEVAGTGTDTFVLSAGKLTVADVPPEPARPEPVKPTKPEPVKPTKPEPVKPTKPDVALVPQPVGRSANLLGRWKSRVTIEGIATDWLCEFGSDGRLRQWWSSPEGDIPFADGRYTTSGDEVRTDFRFGKEAGATRLWRIEPKDDMHVLLNGLEWTRTSQSPRVVPSKIDPYYVGVWTGVVNGATIVSYNYPDGRFQQYIKNGNDLTFLQHGYNRLFAGGKVIGQFLSGSLADKGVMPNTYTVLSPDVMLLAPSTWTRVSRTLP